VVRTRTPRRQEPHSGRGLPSRWSRCAATAFALAVLIPALPASAGATTLEPMPIERVAQSASVIFVGDVVGTRTEQSAHGVRTAVRLWVAEALKGDASGIVTVYVAGGTLPDGSSVAVDGMASFAPGESCCVFADDDGRVLAGYQGKVRLGMAGPGQDAATRSAVTRRIRAVLSGETAQTPAPPEAVSLAVAGPTVSSVTPRSASAGTGSVITISGTGFGATPGTVGFALNLYGVARLKSDGIVSWSDTRIECDVPVGKVGGSLVSAGNGPLVVTTQSGSQSNPYEFAIPFGYAGVKWDAWPVTYLVNPGGVDAVKREGYVDAGALPWNGARSAFSLVDGGLTGTEAAKDDKNVICWSETIPEGIVAVTYVYIDSSRRITECDMQYSDAISWGDGIKPGTRDVQTIATHELGHWLCLLDQYNAGDAEKVMYGFEVVGQRRQLTQGEISGIRWVYPAPSGALHGTVRDALGTPLAGVTVAVDTCEKVVSRADGSFDVPGIPEGSYQVACSLPGYTTRVQPVTIVAEETAVADVTLGPGAPMPVYRFYHRQNGSHFYTSSPRERDAVIADLAEYYTFEGTAYVVNSIDPVNSAPLFRFYNRRNGSHFYTASASERDRVIAELSDTYTFEGVAYAVSPGPARAAAQVFRFYNRRNGSHFYTTSAAEKFAVIRDLGATYTYEGPAFWVAP